jgi:hypothetical protein
MKNCRNCTHKEKTYINEPCASCVNSNKWEPEGEHSPYTLSQAYALIAEMREALALMPRRTYCGGGSATFGTYTLDHGSVWAVDRVLAKADAALAERGTPVRYGCHCDLDTEALPDDCVIGDWFRRNDCDRAKNGIVARKEDCEHWKPIQSK